MTTTTDLYLIGFLHTPFKAVEQVLDHLWAEQLAAYRSSPADGHLFEALVEVANWVNKNPEWAATEYVAAWNTSPADAWRAGKYNDPAADRRWQPLPTSGDGWEWEGFGSRYRLRGRSPSVTVVLGWDNPLETYFAQVWDAPEGADHHEQGELLLWVGCSRGELVAPCDLAAAIREHASLPEDLAYRLDIDETVEQAFGPPRPELQAANED